MKPRFGRRYGLLAAAVATSILLSGTTPAVAIPNPAPAADHIAPADPKVPTNKKERVLLGIAAAQDVATAAQEVRDAHDALSKAESTDGLSYGEAGTQFNKSVETLNANVSSLNLPKIGEQGGPVALDTLGNISVIAEDYRPFTSEKALTDFDNKLDEAYHRSSDDKHNTVVDANNKILAAQKQMKATLDGYYAAIAEAEKAVAAAQEKYDIAHSRLDKNNTREALKDYKAEALAQIDSELKKLDGRESSPAVDAARAALNDAKAKFNAIPDGLPSDNKDAVTAAIAALDAVLKAVPADKPSEKPGQKPAEKSDGSSPFDFLTSIFKAIGSFFTGIFGKGLSS